MVRVVTRVMTHELLALLLARDTISLNKIYHSVGMGLASIVKIETIMQFSYAEDLIVRVMLQNLLF